MANELIRIAIPLAAARFSLAEALRRENARLKELAPEPQRLPSAPNLPEV